MSHTTLSRPNAAFHKDRNIGAIYIPQIGDVFIATLPRHGTSIQRGNNIIKRPIVVIGGYFNSPYQPFGTDEAKLKSLKPDYIVGLSLSKANEQDGYKSNYLFTEGDKKSMKDVFFASVNNSELIIVPYKNFHLEGQLKTQPNRFIGMDVLEKILEHRINFWGREGQRAFLIGHWNSQKLSTLRYAGLHCGITEGQLFPNDNIPCPDLTGGYPDLIKPDQTEMTEDQILRSPHYKPSC